MNQIRRPRPTAILPGDTGDRPYPHRAIAMARALTFVLAISGVAGSAWAQSAPANPAAKSTARTAAPKAKSAAAPTTPTASGPCQVGVIPAIGDQFVVQKIGLTVFGNEETEIPTSGWGLDDLAMARVRAAAAGLAVRRLNYAKAAFDPYYHPTGGLFGNTRNELANIVRQTAANARCERYVVVTRYDGQLNGTNQMLRGIGVVNRGAGALSYTLLFANVQVTVFDGQNFEITKPPLPNLAAVLSAGLTQDPLTKLDNADFPTVPANAAGSATLRDHTRALVSDRLDKILPGYFKPQ